MSVQIASASSATAEVASYESVVEKTLRELAAAEDDAVLEPIRSGEDGPTMSWFIS